MILLRLVFVGMMILTILAVGFAVARRDEPPGERKRIGQQYLAGNYKDAYEGYRRLALDAKTQPDLVASDLLAAAQCLVKLGRIDELDAFREAVIAVHSGNLDLLRDAALSYLNDGEHQGFIVAGKFHAASTAAEGARRLLRPRPGPRLAAPGPRAGSRPDRPRSRRRRAGTCWRSPRPRWATAPRRIPGGSSPSRRSTSCPTTTRTRTGTGAASRPPAPRRARRDARLLPGARQLRQGEERRRALAMGTGPGRRARPR